MPILPAVTGITSGTVMDWGLRNRLTSILRPAHGRCVMLAVDHGYFQGPTTGLERPAEVIRPLLDLVDALMLTRGVLRSCVPADARVPVVLRVSGGTSILNDDLSDEVLTTTIEEAIRLNAACVTLSIFVGSAHERRTLANLARLVDDGQRYGMPVLAVTAVGKEMARDARYLGLACRIAAELGAQFVKTYYCDGFDRVVAGCPVPLVIAGGKKVEEREALEVAHRAMSAGAVGVDMGRNIFQSRRPTAMIRAVRRVVHDRVSPAEAFEEYLSQVG